MMTSRYLTGMGIRHYVVVEPQDVDAYRAAVDRMGLLSQVVELDMTYKSRYDLCDSHGLAKSTGPGPARNFIWDHSLAAGHEWHWVMDDNIRGFFRLNKNLKVPMTDSLFFFLMEEFCLRYINIAMAGPNYFMFASRKSGKIKPFTTNTRIYSCNLIRNDAPFRWRGRYNEDTILSLDMLKAGWCTVQFNAFLQDKFKTQLMKGGNTDELYKRYEKEAAGTRYAPTGTVEKSQMLAREHPDVARVVHRFGRVHHHVDYRPFRKNRLVRKPGVVINPGIDEFGMKLHQVRDLKPGMAAVQR